MTMAAESGNPFSFLSFDIGERHIDINHADRIEITGHHTNVSISIASFNIDGINDGPGPLNDFQNFLLPSTFHNLLSVDFLGLNLTNPSAAGITQGYTIDNLLVSTVPTPPSPLPARTRLDRVGCDGEKESSISMVDIKASGDLRASAAKVNSIPIDLARGNLNIAKRLLPAIDVLAQSPDKVVYGLTMLVAHSLECTLKAYLAHRFSMSEEQDLKKFGHNLEKLWIEAAKNGLSIEVQPPSWCDKLDSMHKAPYLLRYPNKVVLVIPATDVMITGLKSVINAVTECVGQ